MSNDVSELGWGSALVLTDSVKGARTGASVDGEFPRADNPGLLEDVKESPDEKAHDADRITAVAGGVRR